jgi:sterol desaturase/sphingolipid hydroxylase (fatty acid hydroxylase superfamily)
MWTAHFIGYWCINALLYLVYHFNLFAKYKIQPADKWPAWSLVKKCLIERAVSTIFIQPLFFYAMYWPTKFFGLNVTGAIPPISTFVWQMTWWFLVNDFLFYWAHRALHHPKIYGRIHKQHHLFKQTIGIAAEYAHPVEEVLANGIPTFLGAIMTDCHAVVFWFYFLLRMWETVDAHSGYKFPFSPWALLTWIQGGSEPHDWHHSHGHKHGNFGMFRIWDHLCGTDKAYKQWLLDRKYDDVSSKDE